MCKVGWHAPSTQEIWNDGHHFTRCNRCREDLVRPPAGRWSEAPKGFRVVWKDRTEDDIDWQAWARLDLIPQGSFANP
jgi:hypothetical protein